MSSSEVLEGEEIREYTIPLKKAYYVPRSKRASRAIRIIRDFLRRHLKIETVKISNEVNEYIWSRNREKPPRYITIKVKVDREESVAEVFLA
ncbi:MAG: 50S ribosomal protein L31e [Thermoprotei archaeon]|nr:MAG: 50S ribosomal protein L31e [Thermoprotei archaeon]RLF01971.1 MAG: 50S ribosomal protein L31e [Thermoprotei archaeon]